MAAGTLTSRDIQLVIRARDEGTRIVEQFNSALSTMLGLNNQVGASSAAAGSKLAELGSTLVTLDRAAAAFSDRTSEMQQRLASQATGIADTQRRLGDLRGQVDGAREAIVALAIAQRETGSPETAARLAAARTQYAALNAEVRSLENSLGRQRSGFAEQQNAVQAAETQSRSLAAAQTFARQEVDQLTSALERQQSVQTRNAGVLPTVNAATGVTRDRGDYDQLVEQIQQKAAKATRDEADAITKLRNELNPLAVIQAKLAVEEAKVVDWRKRGKISADEERAALKLLREEAERTAKQQGFSGLDTKGRPSLFGLTPYELTNLSYQTNDVFTQIASGTSITQTLAQQGGQILQIFPRAGGAIVAALSNPVILAAVATIGTLVLTLQRAFENAERLRILQGVLEASADGANTSAAALNNVVVSLDHIGLSAEEALGVVRQMFKDGIDPAAFEQVGEAARNLAEVLGIEVVDATKQIDDAFTGNWASIQKLDESLNFLTASEAEHIKSLFEQGKATEAQTEAFTIFSRKMDEGAEKMRGDWKNAVTALKGSWDSLLDTLSNSKPVQSAINGLNNLIGTLQQAVAGTRSLTEEQLKQQLQNAKDSLARSKSTQGSLLGGIPGINGVDAANIAYQESRIRELEAAIADLHKPIAAVGAVAAQNTERQAKATGALTEATAELRGETLKASAADRLAAAEAKARLEADKDLGDDRFKFATDAAKQEYIAQKVAQERAKVAKQIADEGERAARAAKTAADAAERERKERERQLRDPKFQTAMLLRSTEGFKSKAYWDVNAYRVGFGSDTVTRADGRVERVTASTTTSRDDAERDLARRIDEFRKVIERQIGAQRFTEFSPQQQAALTSIAYNYGALPERILAAVRTGTTAQIGAAVRGLAGDNGGKNSARRIREASILELPNMAVEQGSADALDEIVDAQSKFNVQLKQQVEERNRNIAAMKAQIGLQDTELLAAQKQAAADNAVAEVKARLDTINERRREKNLDEIKLTDEQIAEIKKLAAAEFELAHARDAAAARRREATEPLDDVTAVRDALLRRADVLRQFGFGEQANGIDRTVAGMTDQLVKAADAAIDFYRNMSAADMAVQGLDPAKIEAIVLGLQNAKTEAQSFGTFMGVSFNDIARTATQSATSAMDRFAQSLANGENAFHSLWDAFRAFAADFLMQIVKMIEQQLIFNLVSGLLRAAAGAAGGGDFGGGQGGFSLGSNNMIPFHHSGGIIGGPAPTRAGLAAWFNDATRYHSGGIIGLRPNEMPIIAERGEEMLTADDPRHTRNGGGKNPVNVKVINAIDAGDMVSQGLGAAAGERAILNFIRNNRGAVQAAMS